MKWEAVTVLILIGIFVGTTVSVFFPPPGTPTLSTMEAVIDRAGMRWGREDALEYCGKADYLKPPFKSKLVDAEVLPGPGGDDVGTLVCYWKLVR